MDLVFYQIGLSSVYHPYLVTTQLIGSNTLRSKEIHEFIPGDYLMKLVERMPRVCKGVIKAKGGYFEESQIYFDLFNTPLVTTRFRMSYFIKQCA